MAETGDTISTKEHTEAHSGPIKSYRKLSPEEIDLINDIKQWEVQTAELVERIKVMDAKAGGIEPDRRWLAKGITALEEGFMFLVRSVAKPPSPFQ